MQFVLGAGLTEDLDIMSLSAKAQMLSYMSFFKTYNEALEYLQRNFKDGWL